MQLLLPPLAGPEQWKSVQDTDHQLPLKQGDALRLTPRGLSLQAELFQLRGNAPQLQPLPLIRPHRLVMYRLRLGDYLLLVKAYGLLL